MEQLNNKPLKYKDFLVSGETFELVVDKNIKGLLKTQPFPLEEELPSYYKSEEYISHTDSQEGLINTLYHWAKEQNNAYKYKLIRSYAEGKTILDYGCGTGSFLKFMEQKGYSINGFEPNESAASLARTKLKTSAKIIDNTSQIQQPLDIISLWHVLEHIPNPKKKMKELIDTLNPNGCLFIALPNYTSFDAAYYNSYWAAYDVPRHLWHFSPSSVNLFFEDLGMYVVKKHPLWFDSFYVSILSEKYKKSSFPTIRGAFVGLYSNLLASFNGRFSSIIYVLKKKQT